MAVSVFGPFNLNILAYICRIVSVIDLRYKAVIAKIVSYRDLSRSRFAFLPYKLVPVFIDLAKIARILYLSVTGDRAL
jgi:hypothetical protein